MISLAGVRKVFGRHVAVRSLDLEVPRGAVFGLLGHNGAGKSTVIGIVLGQVLPDAGRVRIDGHDVLADRPRALARVGAIYEQPAFYDYLSGARNLKILCELAAPVDPERLREVVRLVDLEDRIHERVSTYSHGMRQRLALAQALLPRPELLILDEPSEGLDPEGIYEMRELIRKLHREWELTVLISSHLLSEMEQVCSHLAVLREGRLLFAGDWRLAAQRRRVRIEVDRQAEAQRGLQEAGLVTEWDESGARLADGVDLAAIAEWLVQRGFRVACVAPAGHALEDFYLDLTRRAPPGGPS